MYKTILITDASSGTGRAAAGLFQQRGWNVIATISEDEKESSLTRLENVLVTRLNVLDPSTISLAMSTGINRFGQIDVVVNNVGQDLPSNFESAARQKNQLQYAINVFGLFDVTRVVLPHFKANKAGLFINFISDDSKIAHTSASRCTPARFAIEGFSESLRNELEATGIGVKIVYNDNALTQYSGTNADVIAELMFTAATDGTKQLRYRRNLNDNAFIGIIKTSLAWYGKNTA